MAAINELDAIATRLEQAANALGTVSTGTAALAAAHVASEAQIAQHVARLTAVANALTNATTALADAAK
jgi:hypothetical protein